MKRIEKVLSRLISAFISFNKRICNRIERRLPSDFTKSLLYRHEMTLRSLLAANGQKIVLDVGSGHECLFARNSNTKNENIIIGTDILFEQLRKNRDIDVAFVSNACGHIPVADGSIDIVSTRSVLEHLPDNKAFFEECRRILKDGGVLVHVFPLKFSLFSILNVVIPQKIKKNMLDYLYPEWKVACGFLAFYDNCDYYSMVRISNEYNLNIAEMELRYYQSIYYTFFVPFYVFSLMIDLLLWYLDIKKCACQMFVVFEKPHPSTD